MEDGLMEIFEELFENCVNSKTMGKNVFDTESTEVK